MAGSVTTCIVLLHAIFVFDTNMGEGGDAHTSVVAAEFGGRGGGGGGWGGPPHTPLSSPRKRGPILPNTPASGIWVPAFAGTTARCYLALCTAFTAPPAAAR